MKDFKTFVNENLLVPRNLEGRKEKLKQMNIKFLQQEVIDVNLELDASFMDIDAKFVKIKKVNGSVMLSGSQWTEIPEWLKDVKISGDFDCSDNKLSSLKNCPQDIEGSFWCSFNKLTSLEGCPKILKRSIHCFDNKVKLKLPDYVNLKGKFYN